MSTKKIVSVLMSVILCSVTVMTGYAGENKEFIKGDNALVENSVESVEYTCGSMADVKSVPETESVRNSAGYTAYAIDDRNVMPMNVNTYYENNLEDRDDEKWYKFSLKKAGYVNISFEHDYIESNHTYWKAYLLHSTDSKELANYKFVGNVTKSQTGNIGLPAGDYYIKITRDDYSDKNYKFQLNYTETNTWEKEFNDTKEEANEIKVNSEVNASLRNSNDDDWYKFSLEKAGYVNISFEHDYIESGSIYWKAYLFYSADNKELANYGLVGNVTKSQTGNIGLPAGDYYIKITNDWYYSDKNYKFQLNYIEIDTWEKEFNDTKEEANEIIVNNKIDASLRNSDDNDWYKFSLEKAGYVNISFEHDYIESGSIYWKAYLFYSTDNKELANYEFAGNVTKSQTGNIGLPAGDYYIKITKGNWYYSDKNYKFQLNYTETNTWEKEFNDTKEEANEIIVNNEIDASLRNSDDNDWYKFSLEKAGYVSISFEHDYIESGSISWKAYLLHSIDSKELANYGFVGNVTKSQTGNIGLPAGDYYIKITRANYSDKNYKLQVNYTETDIWEKEFNDTKEEANEIKLNSEVNASLRNGNDNDWYKFSLEKAGYVNISFEHDYIESESIYWKIYLFYSADNKELANYEFAGNVTKSQTGNIGLPAGDYYIKITNDNWYYSDKNYKFQLNYTETDTWEKEFNDTEKTANEIIVNNKINATLRTGDDIDWYKINLTDKKEINFVFQHDNLKNSRIYWKAYLYNADMKEIKSYAFNGSTIYSYDTLKDLPNGTYYIKIVRDNYSSDNYALGFYDDLNKVDGTTKYGDVNSDGDINVSDAVLLKKHLAGMKNLKIDLQAGDVNADGNINISDAVILLKHLAGMNVTMGKS